MQTIDIAFPKPHAGQLHVIQNERRFTLLCCGRRWGKDILLQRRAAKRVARGSLVGWFAPTYRMMTENWRDLSNILAPITERKSEQEKRLDLITGGKLEFWSLDNPDAPRGRKYHHIAINEAAMVAKLEDAWSMVIRPTLADYRGTADFGSTPRGLNFFFSLWRDAVDKPEWARFHFTTYDNPHIPPDEVDAMVAALPERVVRQEILAEFVEDGAYFQNVDAAAIVPEPDAPSNHDGHELVMAVDWALSHDFTVIGVACRECNRVVDWDRFNQIDFTYQRERLYAMAERWNVAGCLPERNSIGQPNIEIIRERVRVMYGPDGGLGFNTTAGTKPPLIQGLASALEHDGFQVPVEAADELRSYEVELSTSGHPKFGAPDGLHDDWVMMLALLWRAMTSAPRVGSVPDPFASW